MLNHNQILQLRKKYLSPSLSLSYDKVTGFVDIPEFFVAESAEHSANERNVDFLAVKLADGTSVRFAAKFDTLHQATRGEGFLFL